MKNNKFLILLSLLLFITYFFFIWMAYNAARDTFDENIHSWATSIEHTFAISLDEKSTAMQQIATYVGNDPKIIKLFLECKTTLQKNNNNYNAPDVKKIRKVLYDTLKHSWDVMRAHYDVRQLHFHFGPGSRSFLRVHAPKKFGDTMDQVRYTIVDANTLRIPTKGFETGRIYTGIRGVIPVFIAGAPSEQPIHIGALEAGTSFSFLLKMLHDSMSTNFAVLLTEEHIRKNMWPEFIAKKFAPSSRLDSFFLEDSTQSPSLTQRIFNLATQQNMFLGKQPNGMVKMGNQRYQIALFPLRDYRGTLSPDLPNAGMVLCWEDITATWEDFTLRMRNACVIACFSIIFLEIVLIAGWHFGSKQLKQIIKKQTQDLESLACTDQLTGILNRWKLEELFIYEINRHKRYNTTFSVIMFDLDHFKKVNDTWGHDVGDIVLKEVVRRTSQMIRDIDIFARWGGEEFLILLPETDLQLAQKVAKRIRVAIEGTKIHTTITITLSLGVIQHVHDESMADSIKRADKALYTAKNEGRNRVCCQ